MTTYRCGGCGHTVQVKDAAAGTRVFCPKCGQAGQIPTPEAGSSSLTLPSADTSNLSGESSLIKFRCGCGKKIGVSAESSGKQVRCPQCGNVVHVPGGPAKKPSLQDDGETSLLALAEQEAKSPATEKPDLLDVFPDPPQPHSHGSNNRLLATSCG